MALFALILALLQLGNYCGVQCQQPTSVTGLQPTPLTVNRELQRLTEEVAQVKESINDLRNILQVFGVEFAQVREKLGDVERNCKHDEIQTCTPPIITHLGFNHGPMSSTLTCTSTGSPATAVTWMKDGQSLTIDGSIYYVTYRSTSATYEHILTINAAASTIYRHTYTCTVLNALGSDSKILTAPPPPIVSTVSSPGRPPTAGEPFFLTCSVTLADEGSLTEDLTVQWEAPVDIQMDSAIQVITTDSTVTRTSTLRFTPVRMSHGGKYTCKASTTGGTDMSTETLTVQLPPPTITVSHDPDASVTLRHGDPLTLTCTIQLDPDPAVDNDVVVTGNLQGQAGSNSTPMMASAGVYKIRLYITSLQATASDTYTCTATVKPGSGVMYVQQSESIPSSLSITVELAVNIRVSYTPPPGFTPGANEYRAASGPVTVTCTAVGARGTEGLRYQWSSTCRDCSIRSLSSSRITRTAVHSGDTGIHTCTATSGSLTGSASINFNVVGAGIHVFIGVPPGSLPNNGLVISLNTARNGFLFRFFCRSDSMMETVGMFIGLDNTIITTGNVFDITRPQAGELRVANTPSQTALTTLDQGVYTCRIPLQSGEIRDINIGIYPSGFNTPPNITHLGFTHGPMSSNLTCISTGSPATTVNWMRDGQPLIVDGSIYQLTQTVTNRRLSTYRNVLTINAAVSNIYRHTYTCNITSALGSASKALTATPLPRVIIFPPGGTPTAGTLFSFICTVTLADGGPLTEDLTVQWKAPFDISMDSDIQVITTATPTLTLTNTMKFTPVRTSHGGRYTCQATTTAGTDKATETLTVKIPPPTLLLSRDPDASVTLHHEDSLTLTCTIRLDPAVVDSDVTVTGSLAGPGGRSTTMVASAGEYRITLDIPSLQATSSGTYTCTATVMPGPGVMHVTGSESHSSLDITVVLGPERCYTDCRDAYLQGERNSGVYTIRPVLTKPPFDVYCNMDTDGGGWTVFQRRQDGSQDFFLYWDDYERGFGNLTGEFWLGLSKIHCLTASAARSELRVDLRNTASAGSTTYAKYREFGVGNSASKYTLSLVGYTGTAGDAMTTHSGQKFSTRDRDNDNLYLSNCAVLYSGAWWYQSCFRSSLNGVYKVRMLWSTLQQAGMLVYSEMKLRSA